MNPPQKLLFVCNQNIQRSLTAERMYAGFSGYQARSAGTEESARIPIKKELIDWADLIFVMEAEHMRKLQAMFGAERLGKKVVCLHIPDRYRCMEPALIEELKAKLRAYVEVPA